MIFDSPNIEDGILDFFGKTPGDSYRAGYERGFAGKHRDVNLFGQPEKGTVRGESKHRHEFKKGYADGRADRDSIIDLEQEEDRY